MVEGLSTFSVLFTLYLSTLHDAEFYREREGESSSHFRTIYWSESRRNRFTLPPLPSPPTPPSLAPVVPVMSHMPFSLSELAAMAVVLRDIFISLHMERHLPPTYSLSRSVAPPITKPHPQVCQYCTLKLNHVLKNILHVGMDKNEGSFVGGFMCSVPARLSTPLLP